jgi:Ca-activated chloride channel family protein
MTFEFAWPWLLAALPLPLLVAWWYPRAPDNPGSMLRIPFFAAVAAARGVRPAQRSRLRLTLATLIWLLLVLAAARPQFVGEAISMPVSGRDLLLAVDISGSMQTEDMVLKQQTTDRLTAVKAVAGDFIERRAGDRLGLILFGQQAYLQTPLTFDRDTVRTLLNEAAIGLAGRETAIGDAIGLAVKRLREQPQDNRVLILLTDGANTAGAIEPLRAADLAAKEGVRIYTIGIGADQMTVRSLFGSQRVNPSADLDETMLTAIAEKTGGRYFRARDIEGLAGIYQLLDQLEPVSADSETLRPVAELYAWPLAAAFIITLGLLLAASRLWRLPVPARAPTAAPVALLRQEPHHVH